MIGFNFHRNTYFGIPFLDEKLNITEPSMVLIEQDEMTQNHEIFEKLFVAQAVQNITRSNSEQKIFVRSRSFEIPKAVNISEKKSYSTMKIAWRYNRKQAEIIRSFDLFESTDPGAMVEFSENIKVQNYTLISGLGALHEIINNQKLFELKKIVYETDSILLATSPIYLHKENIDFALFFDIILSLEFTHATENDYHGLLKIKKFTNKTDTLIFGFRIGRYGIDMEEFEIAPDKQVKRDNNENISF